MSDGSTPGCLLKRLMNGWFDAMGSDGNTEIDQPQPLPGLSILNSSKGSSELRKSTRLNSIPQKPAWLRPSPSSSVISVISNWEEEKEKSSTNLAGTENIFIKKKKYFYIRAENVRDGGCPSGVRPAFRFLSKFVPAHNPDTRGEILNIIEILNINNIKY